MADEMKIEWAKGKEWLNNKPLILTYQIDIDIIKSLEGHIFSFPNNEWAAYVYNNRLGINTQDKRYDYVYGHLADGIMPTLIRDIKKGFKTFEDFKREIIPGSCKEFYYDQLLFRTEHSLNALKKINEEVL